jgi:hypothetical protein
MNWSPQLMLAIAKARVKGKNPAEAVARIFAKSTLELRSGTKEIWRNSLLLGESDISVMLSTPTSVRMANQAEIKISQVGQFTWFCVRSKRYPQMYWADSADSITQPSSNPYFAPKTTTFIHTMQIPEIK